MAKTSDVDGDDVPCRHFGVVLTMKQWHELAERLQAARTQFIIEPHIRFKGEAREQATRRCASWLLSFSAVAWHAPSRRPKQLDLARKRPIIALPNVGRQPFSRRFP